MVFNDQPMQYKTALEPLQYFSKHNTGTLFSDSKSRVAVNNMYEPIKVLVINDNASERLASSIALTQAGCTVLEAGNREQALAKCQHSAPDIILLNSTSTNLDAFNICANLRQEPSSSQIPILIILRENDLQAIERAYHSGATDFITRPTQWRIAHQHLRHILRVNQELQNVRKHEQALDQAKDQAETANQAKSDFLSMISHELRSPMTGVLGALNLLLKMPLPPEAMRYTQIAHNAAQSMLGILNDLLDSAKLEAGKITIEATDFSVTQVTDEVVELIRLLAAEKGLTLTVEHDAALPRYLHGDPGHLRQVLLNLVNNAIKFTQVGGININITYDASRELLKCTVTDSGIGIPPEVQQRLFTRFTQADESIYRNYGGTGLGLAICKQLCHLMGGEIGVSSILNHGSSFWFTIHCELGKEIVADRVMPTPDITSKPLKILVADDSPINQLIIEKLLSKAGHELKVVNNGRKALAAIQQEAFDLILMDVQMPELDGIETTQAIRNAPDSYAAIPIIALTASVLPEQITHYQAIGMNNYVSKPFTEETLLAAINHEYGKQLSHQLASAESLDNEQNRRLADWKKTNPFDVKQLEGVSQIVGMPMLNTLLEQGLTAVEEQRTKIHSAWRSGDIQQINKIAHRLKGEAALLGFERIAAIAGFLSINTETSGLEVAIQSLEQAYQHTVAAVAAELPLIKA